MQKQYDLNSNLIRLFNGTYETFWTVQEYDDGDELEVNYNQPDLMRSIIGAYKSNQPQILRDLKQATNFITDIQFKDTYYSPREYNFSTDTIDFTIQVNKTALKKILNELEHSQPLRQFLKSEFTSRDGFISFTPDNYVDLKNAIETDNRESDQAIGALIQYLAQDVLNDIEENINEYWSGNGYCGLNYEIV